MIRQILKMIGKQWKKNFWIILELFIVFALMWYVVDYFSILFINSRTPVGFEIKDTYLVNMSYNQKDNPDYIDYGEDSEEPARNYLRIIEHIKNHPDVEGVSIGQWHYPYCSSNMSSSYHHDTLRSQAIILYVTKEYFDMFKVHPAGGGSPSQLGNALENGVLITQSMEKKLFPDTTGDRQFIHTRDSSETYFIADITVPLKEYIYSVPKNYIYFLFKESSMMELDESELSDEVNICIKGRSRSSNRDFAENFKNEMTNSLAIGNFYLAAVTPLEDMRKQTLKVHGIYNSIRYRTGFTIFFLFNVFLGVIGTFWLRIEKRKEEIGLRIAVGSSRNKIMKQLMTESLVLMLIALIPAIIIWLNLIMMEILPVNDADITWQRILLNTLFTIIPLAIIILLATWYPARKSATIQPAEALHYE